MSTVLESSASRTVAASPPSSQLPCAWKGHCLGASCNTNDDCDNDWICTNRICSPCCEVTTPSSTSTSLNSSTSTSLPPQGIKPGLAIGIGVSIPLFIGIICALVFLILRGRRRKAYGPAQGIFLEKRANDSPGRRDAIAEDQRPIMPAQAHFRAELASPSQATEIWSTELAELEGDFHSGRQSVGSMSKSAIRDALDLVEPRRSARGYRFEEYVVSPNTCVQGELSFSPVSETSTISLRTGNNSPLNSRRP